MRRRLRAGALVAVLGLAGPASAGGLGPLTGSWSLELRCKGAAAGASEKVTATYFLPIQHTAATGQLDAGAGDTGPMQGQVVLDAAKPDRFWLTLTSCELGDPKRGLAVHAKGKLDGDGGRGRGSAVLFEASLGRASACKAKIERTSSGAPPVLACP